MSELPVINAGTNGHDPSHQEIIQVRILTKRNAEEVYSEHKGREFIVEEIMLGEGKFRKPIKYTNQFLSYGYECRAVVLSPGKIRII